MNTPVSFPLAKLLKEKGFDEPCRFVHDNWNNIEDWYDIGREYHRNSEKNASVYYSAPTIAEVVMWLHKEHKIWISVDPDNDTDTWFHTISHNKFETVFGNYSSGPIECYEKAIEHVLNNMI